MLPISLVFAGIGLHVSYTMIPAASDLFVKAGLFGIDLNKRTTKRVKSGSKTKINGIKVPEAMGAVSSTVFLAIMFFFIPMHRFTSPSHENSEEYLAAILCVCCMAFLGFADNVLDLIWRDKIVLTMLASLPLLMVYHARGGPTAVLLPVPLQTMLGIRVVELGVLFYVAIFLLTVFWTQCINILAGVNGLEAGQAAVIAFSTIIFNIVQLLRGQSRHYHLFSLYILLPFFATTLGLLRHNWFPSRVFVGDTFCYFAGMIFAVVGILGHFPKTLMLFFIPQLLNFVMFLPQMFRIVPCPRHRMPAFDADSNCVCCSYAELAVQQVDQETGDPKGLLLRFVIRLFSLLHLIKVKRGRSAGTTHVLTLKVTNFTIINTALHLMGPMREDVLTKRLLIFQGICSVFAFIIRFVIPHCLYNKVE